LDVASRLNDQDVQGRQQGGVGGRSLDAGARFEHVPTSDEGDAAIAKVTAARAFVLGEWMGATLMLLSFTQLYVIVLGRLGSARIAVAVGVVLLAFGSWTFFRSRMYYNRIGLPMAHRFHMAATVAAGAAGIFWLLFLLLAVLVTAGIEVT
jgi:hypothetical protein